MRKKSGRRTQSRKITTFAPANPFNLAASDGNRIALILVWRLTASPRSYVTVGRLARTQVARK